MKRLLIIGLLVVMFFILGCGNKPTYVPCCVNVSDTITCYYGEDHFTVDPANCTGEGVNMTCNATNIDINGTLMNFTNMRACNTGEENPCVHHGCYAMVCGESYYDLREDPSYCMLVKNQTITPNTNAPTGLYGSKCAFYELDEITQKKLNKGAWVNSFRAGVGENYSQFEEAKWYFPITDRLTYANPSGFVDRYRNYLPGQWGSSESESRPNENDLANIISFQTGAGLCELNTSLNAYVCTLEPDIKVYLDAYHGAKGTAQAWCNHLCFHMTQNNVSKCTADVPEGWRAPWLNSDYSYILTMPWDYAWLLLFVYEDYTGFELVEYYHRNPSQDWSHGLTSTSIGVGDDGDPYYENTSGWTDGKGTWHIGMPFECLKHSDCISGNCGWNEYKRFSCVDKNTSKEIDCGIELDDEDKPVFKTKVVRTNWFLKLYGSDAHPNVDYLFPGYPYADWDYFDGDPDEPTLIDYTEPFNTDEDVIRFWTEEHPHDLKFIKACNMVEGDDYEVEHFGYHWNYDVEWNFPEPCNGKKLHANSSSFDTVSGFPDDYFTVAYAMRIRKELGDNDCSSCTNYTSPDDCTNAEEFCGDNSYKSIWCCTRHNLRFAKKSYIPDTWGTDDAKSKCGDHQMQHAKFGRYLIKIRSFGRCEMETKNIQGEDKTVVKVNKFGWCEPATFLGFDIEYNPDCGIPNYHCGSNCEITGDDATKFKNCMDKIANYQQNNIIPVFFALDNKFFKTYNVSDEWCGVKGTVSGCSDSNSFTYYIPGYDYTTCNLDSSDKVTGTSYYECRGVFGNDIAPFRFKAEGKTFECNLNLHDTLYQNNHNQQTLNKIYTETERAPFPTTGAAIIVVDTFKSNHGNHNGNLYDSGFNIGSISRARFVKKECPYCLTGIMIVKQGNYMEGIDNRKRGVNYLFNYDPTTERYDHMVSSAFDVVLLEMPSNEGITENNFADMLNVSKHLVRAFNKPSIWVFSESSAPPDYEYLFAHQRELTDSGVIGIIHLPWKKSGGSSIYMNRPNKGATFCSFQKGANKLIRVKVDSNYMKVTAMNNTGCECQPCSDVEISAGVCNPICADGKYCDGYTPGADVKCSSGGVCARMQNCTPCTNMTQYLREHDVPDPHNPVYHGLINNVKYDCSILTPNGSVVEGPKGNFDNLSILWPDVIASLPDSFRCCVVEPQTRSPVTFIKQSYSSTDSELDIWNRKADDAVECGKPPSGTNCTWCQEVPTLPIDKGELICNVIVERESGNEVIEHGEAY